MATATAANPQGGNNDPFNVRTGVNLLALAANGYATTMTPFLRRGFGSEALGINGIVAALIILVYAGATHCPEMITFFWVWLGFVAYQRIYGLNLRRQGHVVHSRYAGWPEVGLRFTKSAKIARQVVEPLVCLVAGAVLFLYSEPLGRFVMLGPIGLLVSQGIDGQVMKSRLTALRDAEIEQRHLSDLFNGRGEI